MSTRMSIKISIPRDMMRSKIFLCCVLVNETDEGGEDLKDDEGVPWLAFMNPFVVIFVKATSSIIEPWLERRD